MHNLLHYALLVAVVLVPLLFSLFQNKPHSLKEYALANKSLRGGVAVLTLLATFLASGDLSDPYFIEKYGILEIRETLFFIISFLYVGYFIAPKIVFLIICSSL